MFAFLDILFGCFHKNVTFPITRRGHNWISPASAVTGTYIVCLDCGKEFPYDWEEMKVVSSRKRSTKSLPAEAAQFEGKKQAA